MSARLLLTASLAGLLSSALPALAQSPVSDSAASEIKITVKDGVFETDSTNRRFTVVQYWPEGSSEPVHVLIKEEMAAVLRDDSEGPVSASVTVSTWRVGTDGSRKPGPGFKLTGDSGSAAGLDGNDAFYRVVEYGCCGALDRSTFFSLESGKPLLSVTGEPATLEVPNAGGIMRVAGILPFWAADRDETFAKFKDALAIVTYADRTHTLQRALLKGPVDKSFDDLINEVMSEPVVGFRKADGSDAPDAQFTLWSADGKKDPAAITDAVFSIEFTPDYKVEIPVAADKLDIAHATLPKGFTLEALPAN
ncbi:MAG TPA: hypothetical protein VHA10_04750 [Hypericibacter adhaerens]|jgi:hypothetical protein|uniref:DUF4424 domain-containing protein n=1 Tax=Hypericibacter adhaerens TaxID=2602016 RepID=A0A5J6MW55_9PROT|nr:hypothetical protein [Hypericibacter adhaerens]QEX21699.1 hypothetical protein FRZ61_16280 [Hypericibacter adhaerens]HWA42497.1 hypothetical protein [Hypericibacter adhaerens]